MPKKATNNYFRQDQYTSHPLAKRTEDSLEEYQARKAAKIQYKSQDFSRKPNSRVMSPHQQSVERPRLEASSSHFSSQYQSIKSIAKKIEQSTNEQHLALHRQMQVTSS